MWLKIALERLDRFIGQLQRVDFGELVLQELDLVGREFDFAGQAFALGDEPAPRTVAFLIRGQCATRPPKQVEQLELAAFLQQSPRFARAVKIDPVFAEALQCRQRGETAVDRELRRLFAREAALQHQQAVFALRQIELRKQRVDFFGIGKTTPPRPRTRPRPGG